MINHASRYKKTGIGKKNEKSNGKMLSWLQYDLKQSVT